MYGSAAEFDELNLDNFIAKCQIGASRSSQEATQIRNRFKHGGFGIRSLLSTLLPVYIGAALPSLPNLAKILRPNHTDSNYSMILHRRLSTLP
jgi:hypothetical protein